MIEINKQIIAYFKDSSAGVTKERYFEICEAMGSEPIEGEIPVEISDFPDIVQNAFQVYGILQDNWEGMSGTYMGKVMSGIIDIFDILEMDKEDRKVMLELVSLIDSARSKQISSSKPKNKTPTT